ncbi:uncharacterized protein LOC128197917, partial [Vigna angularis]|uniref:uncharacterized protein LOC128197917 n=1 Tax=Phaseolus angularis TaxID=3914 RepID=UPI0022B4FAC9
MEMFKKLEISIPFSESLQQMPSYAKFLKELLTKMRKYIEKETIEVKGNCSAIIQQLPPKFKDPGSFTIPCTIGELEVGRALIDLGANINLMSLSIFKRIEGLELKPTRMALQLADRSIKYPYGVVEDVLVNVDKFVFPVDFVIMDLEENGDVPLILGRPFLKTARVLIDVENGKLKLTVQDEEVNFDVFQAMTHPKDDKACFQFDILDEVFMVQERMYRKMPFGLCNAPATFQRCMQAIFADLLEKCIEVFMDDFSVFGNSFQRCLANLNTVLKRCVQTNLVLNWEKCHFMVTEGIVLGFYRRFIKDFSKIAKPLSNLLMKDAPFVMNEDCLKAFDILKQKLVSAPVIAAPDWNQNFELMCDASDYAIGVVLGQRKEQKFHPIYYASKVLNDAQLNYATTEKEFLAIVYALEKFRPYLIGSKVIVYTDHAAIKYLLTKPDSKPRLIRWVLLLQEFDVEIRDKKGSENLIADHLSRLVNNEVTSKEPEIWESFSDESLMYIQQRPWFADMANFKAARVMPEDLTWQQRKKFLHDVFDCWGIDFVGPFPPSFNNEYILVAVDYVSKWVEALACPKNDASTVIKFLKRQIFSRFGTPRVLISDGGSHFCNYQLEKVLKHYGVKHKVAAPYHPQTNGQAEVSNREIKRILEKTVTSSRKDWSLKLDDALWAYRTAMKTSMGLSPFQLVYGKACHLPVELEHRALWILELEEMRLHAYDSSRAYKDKIKFYHDR